MGWEVGGYVSNDRLSVRVDVSCAAVQRFPDSGF